MFPAAIRQAAFTAALRRARFGTTVRRRALAAITASSTISADAGSMCALDSLAAFPALAAARATALAIPRTHQAFRPKANQIFAMGFSQRLTHKVAVGGVAVLDKRALQRLLVRAFLAACPWLLARRLRRCRAWPG